MPPSHFDQHFSQAEQAKLAAWLDANPTMSVDGFRDLLAERGLVVARSTAHKEKQKLEELGRRLRQSRAAMDTLAAGLEDKDDSARSRALLEMCRTIVFEYQEAVLESGGVVDSKDLARLTRLLKDLMQAGRFNQEIAASEKRRLAEAVGRKLDEAATEADGGGDPTEVILRVRREIYGIFDD